MSAHGAGKAYAIGLMMGLMSKGLTYDEAKWVNLHPAGKGPKASGEGNKNADLRYSLRAVEKFGDQQPHRQQGSRAKP